MALGTLRRLRTSTAASLLKQGVSPIAVDFGATGLKLLQVTLGDSPTLVAAATLPTPERLLHDPEKRLAFQMEQFPRLVKQAGFRGKRAVCVAPSSRMFVKHLQLAALDHNAMSEQIDLALAEQFGERATGYAHREIIVEGVTHAGNRREVICLAMPRDLINSMMRLLRNSKLDPVGIHTEPQALLRATAAFGIRDGDGEKPPASMLVDIGWSKSTVVIVHGKAPVFARILDVGGRHFDDAVAARTKLPVEEARRERIAMTSIEDGSDNAATLAEPVEMLVDDLGHCQRYHDMLFHDRRVARVVFVGGESRQRALCEMIARRLRLSACLADPMAGVGRTGKEPSAGIDFGPSQPGWAVALGACLRPTDL